ncbi:NAD(P)H-dependent flavin oxidoreductase [Streptomyces tanashiensis]|uniref:Propionate 3-nitronate monooxygenase n=1 Tax=Streptomyces tanashiensis TaxID=67367 RepID=A0ABY6R2D2_9ACTN|nr:nitronate monooxygenase [Streptomyces tanashiensis]UZX24218.1 nitronate monooxygenase [Streptomyces tanashiensis]GGY22016.1 nitronate monooxygenase [Streptomyces tanashiensis]
MSPHPVPAHPTSAHPSPAVPPGRFGDLVGIPLPVVQGPFGGGLSSVELAAAVSEGGGLGSYGAHIHTPEEITALVARLRAATGRPFAVNLWVPQEGERTGLPEAALAEHIERLRPYYEELGVRPPSAGEIRAWPDFDAQLDALIAAAPPVISLVMGLPPRRLVAEARRRGIVVVGTATTVEEAVALEAAGVDAVVASGSDAGGHRGAFLRPVRESLVGTFSLVPQVADAVTVPVVAAGGIADGRGVAAALALGADAVQVGTGFLATRESGASEAHRRVLGTPEARTTVLTRLFSGRTARGIPNGFVRDMAAHEERVPPYPVQNVLMGPVRRAAAEQGRPEYVNLWAGQAAALAQEPSAAAYLSALAEGAVRAAG